MKRPGSLSLEQLLLAVVLGGLLLLGVFLWFDDATHQPMGESRFFGRLTPSSNP